MPRPKRSALLVAGLVTLSLLLALAACREVATRTPTPTPEPIYDVEAAREELAAARALWESKGSHDYQVEFMAFLGAYVPMHLTVRDGDIVSAEYRTRFEYGEPIHPDDTSGLRTVDGLFDDIEKALSDLPRPAWSVTAEYDPQYGYPRDLGISYDPNIVDGYFGGGFSNYQPFDPSSPTATPEM